LVEQSATYSVGGLAGPRICLLSAVVLDHIREEDGGAAASGERKSGHTAMRCKPLSAISSVGNQGHLLPRLISATFFTMRLSMG